MTVHAVGDAAEILGMISAVAVLIILALAVAIRHRPTVLPGSSGHREQDRSQRETIRADGFIDSFSNEIEEAGGGMPIVVRLALIVVPAWYVVYVVLFWSPR
jgi:hypothetical protein